MPDLITVTGLVATTPKNVVTGTGLAVTTFRLASNHRRYDKAQQKWVDVDTNWFTVTSFRQLAANVVVSLQKGQRILVTGRLRVRDWSSDDKKGTSVEIDAESIGHDLAWGTAAFTRSAAAAVADAEAEAAPAMAAEGAAPGEGAGPMEDGEAHLPVVAEPQAVEAAAPF
jgi:single-strand DNA-binding protein